MWELIVYHKFLTIVYIITVILYFCYHQIHKNEHLLPKRFRFSALIVLLFFIAALYVFSFKSIGKTTNKTISEIFVVPIGSFYYEIQKNIPCQYFRWLPMVLIVFTKKFSA